MKPIPISSCTKCYPERWIVLGVSKYGYIYKCIVCGEKTNLLLRKKGWKEDESRESR